MTVAWLCLALALVLGGGRVGVDPADRAGATRSAASNLPLALDLTAVALRAGQPLERALLAGAPAAGDAAGGLVTVARLLTLGADPAEAWAAVSEHSALAAVAVAARRSAHSGIRVAAAFESLAADLRGRAGAAGLARAHKAGVLAAAPLGLCFLPGFVCLAIVPAVTGLAATVLH